MWNTPRQVSIKKQGGGYILNNIEIIKAKGNAMKYIGVLIKHDREALMHILSRVQEYLLTEQAMEAEALFQANLAIQRAKHGKA
jgi:hypothetical protein